MSHQMPYDIKGKGKRKTVRFDTDTRSPSPSPMALAPPSSTANERGHQEVLPPRWARKGHPLRLPRDNMHRPQSPAAEKPQLQPEVSDEALTNAFLTDLEALFNHVRSLSIMAQSFRANWKDGVRLPHGLDEFIRDVLVPLPHHHMMYPAARRNITELSMEWFKRHPHPVVHAISSLPTEPPMTAKLLDNTEFQVEQILHGGDRVSWSHLHEYSSLDVEPRCLSGNGVDYQLISSNKVIGELVPPTIRPKRTFLFGQAQEGMPGPSKPRIALRQGDAIATPPMMLMAEGDGMTVYKDEELAFLAKKWPSRSFGQENTVYAETSEEESDEDGQDTNSSRGSVPPLVELSPVLWIPVTADLGNGFEEDVVDHEPDAKSSDDRHREIDALGMQDHNQGEHEIPERKDGDSEEVPSEASPNKSKTSQEEEASHEKSQKSRSPVLGQDQNPAIRPPSEDIGGSTILVPVQNLGEVPPTDLVTANGVPDSTPEVQVATKAKRGKKRQREVEGPTIQEDEGLLKRLRPRVPVKYGR